MLTVHYIRQNISTLRTFVLTVSEPLHTVWSIIKIPPRNNRPVSTGGSLVSSPVIDVGGCVPSPPSSGTYRNLL